MVTSPAVQNLRLPPLPTVRDLIRMYRIRAVKQLSQNFLMDQRITDKIVKSAGKLEDCYVCEVGPGPGGITRSILQKNVAQLVVVEKDKRFLPGLELLADAAGGRVKIILGDVMNYNMAKAFPTDIAKPWNGPCPSVNIIGNLPFNVSTYLIICWLKAMSEKNNAWSYGRTRLTLTFQKEVAERMVAPIGSPQRCRLSVMCQHLCTVVHKFTIPGRAFVPKPDVDVGVVNFTPLTEPLIQLPFTLVEKVVRCAFAFRQKYCRRGIQTLFPVSVQEELSRKMFRLAEVESTLRPFQISVDEFDRLCHAYKEICEEFPEVRNYNQNERSAKDYDINIHFAEGKKTVMECVN